MDKPKLPSRKTAVNHNTLYLLIFTD